MSIRILFVCLGNICRSPLAEAALRAEAERLGIDIETDSAGTGDWHVGHPPDPRARAAARRHGVDIDHLRARRVKPADFHLFDHVVALDEANLRELRRMRPVDARAELSLLLDHVEGREGEPVVDPYHGDDSHFDNTWADVAAGARALAAKLARQG
ncbi:MAG TPA: low molecular weight protein-tyrosine-phosphatase [Allosphingosinicella sp.]|nr:low molecular weight protein-tyrosine-phosphatase [Allosphingosinicella sp.]